MPAITRTIFVLLFCLFGGQSFAASNSAEQCITLNSAPVCLNSEPKTVCADPGKIGVPYSEGMDCETKALVYPPNILGEYTEVIRRTSLYDQAIERAQILLDAIERVDEPRRGDAFDLYLASARRIGTTPVCKGGETREVFSSWNISYNFRAVNGVATCPSPGEESIEVSVDFKKKTGGFWSFGSWVDKGTATVDVPVGGSASINLSLYGYYGFLIVTANLDEGPSSLQSIQVKFKKGYSQKSGGFYLVDRIPEWASQEDLLRVRHYKNDFDLLGLSNKSGKDGYLFLQSIIVAYASGEAWTNGPGCWEWGRKQGCYAPFSRVACEITEASTDGSLTTQAINCADFDTQYSCTAAATSSAVTVEAVFGEASIPTSRELYYICESKNIPALEETVTPSGVPEDMIDYSACQAIPTQTEQVFKGSRMVYTEGEVCPGATADDCATDSNCSLTKGPISVGDGLEYYEYSCRKEVSVCSLQKTTSICGGFSMTVESDTNPGAFAKEMARMEVANLVSDEIRKSGLDNPGIKEDQIRVFGGDYYSCKQDHGEGDGWLGGVVGAVAAGAVGVATGGTGFALLGYIAGGSAIGEFVDSQGDLAAGRCCERSLRAPSGFFGLNQCDEDDVLIATARRDAPKDLSGRYINDGRARFVGRDCNQSTSLGNFLTSLFGGKSDKCEIETQHYCVFPDYLSKVLQEQGRSYLKRLATQGFGDSKSMQRTVDYIQPEPASSTARWADETIQVGSVRVIYAQMPPYCADPTAAIPDSGGIDCDPDYPVPLIVASCDTSGVNGGACDQRPGLDATGNPEVGAWRVSTVLFDSTLPPVALSNTVLLEGRCSKSDWTCNLDFTYYESSTGGKAKLPVSLDWAIRTTGDTGYGLTTAQGKFVFQVPRFATSGEVSQVFEDGKITLRWREIDADVWQSFQVPLSITDPMPIPGTDQVVPLDSGEPNPAEIVGGCDQNTGTCNYVVMVPVHVTMKPWSYREKVGNGWVKRYDCTGFTTEQLSLIDFGEIDLSEWIDYETRKLPDVGVLRERAREDLRRMVASTLDGQDYDRINTGGSDLPFWVDKDALPGSDRIAPDRMRKVTLVLGTHWPMVNLKGEVRPDEYKIVEANISWGDGTTTNVPQVGSSAVRKTHQYAPVSQNTTRVIEVLLRNASGAEFRARKEIFFYIDSPEGAGGETAAKRRASGAVEVDGAAIAPNKRSTEYNEDGTPVDIGVPALPSNPDDLFSSNTQ